MKKTLQLLCQKLPLLVFLVVFGSQVNSVAYANIGYSRLSEAAKRNLGIYFVDFDGRVETRAPASGPGGQATGACDAATIWNMLVGFGFTAAQAAGIIGNFWVENASPDGIEFDPNITNGIGAYGLAQWLGGRKQALLDRPGGNTIEGQVQFAYDEMTTPIGGSLEHQAFQAVKANAGDSAADARAAALDFERLFERSGGAALQERQDHAAEIYDRNSRGNLCAE